MATLRHDDEVGPEWLTIDALAQSTAITVRSIRDYQARGLPPRRWSARAPASTAPEHRAWLELTSTVPVSLDGERPGVLLELDAAGRLAIRDLAGTGALQDQLTTTNDQLTTTNTHLCAVLGELQETNGQRLERVATELHALNAKLDRLLRHIDAEAWRVPSTGVTRERGTGGCASLRLPRSEGTRSRADARIASSDLCTEPVRA